MLCFHSLSILACRKNHGCKHTILLLQRKKQRLHEHLDHTLKITSLSCWDSARKLKNFSSDMWYHFTKLVHLISNQCSGWFCDFLPFFSCIPYFSSPSNFFFFFLLNKAGPEVQRWWKTWLGGAKSDALTGLSFLRTPPWIKVEPAKLKVPHTLQKWESEANQWLTSNSFRLLVENRAIMNPKWVGGMGTAGSSWGPSSFCHLEL